MNKTIAEILREQNFEQLPQVSLEHEIQATLEAETIRVSLEHDLDDAARTVSLSNALEDLAFVVQTIHEPTPQEAALIQIAGDTAMAGSGMTGSEITPALEDAGETGATISAKVRSAIEAILKALRDLIVRVASTVKKYLTELRSIAGGAQRRQTAIKSRLKDLDDIIKKTSVKDIEFSFPVVGKKGITDFAEFIQEAAKYTAGVDGFLKDANSFNIEYASGLVKLYEQIGGEASVVENLSALRDIARSTATGRARYPLSTKTVPNTDYFEISVTESEEMLGGMSMFKTEAVMKAEPDALSSASVKQALDELTGNIGIKIKAVDGGFDKKTYKTQPMTYQQMVTALKIADELIEHYSGKSEHSSLMAATDRRAEFAERSVEHITKYVDKIAKGDIDGKEYAMAAQRVCTSIMTNATAPYNAMTTCTARVIAMIHSAVLKSMRAYDGAADAKAEDINTLSNVVDKAALNSTS